MKSCCKKDKSMIKKAAVFCGADIKNYDFLKKIDLSGTYIICADSGLRHANALCLEPDLVVGDHDSWKEAYPTGADIIECVPEKDYTDTALCIDKAIELGCDNISLFGATGGRLDHEFSHLCLMAKALKKGARVKMIDENNQIWMENKPFKLLRSDIEKDEKKYISFFPFGSDVNDFSIKGLKYKAKNICLEFSDAVASSNEFDVDEKAEITFSNGIVLVMVCKDPSDVIH